MDIHQKTGKIPFFIPKSTALAYEQIQSFIDDYLLYQQDMMIDYIHGDDELITICDKHDLSLGIHMPVIERKDLFPFIQMGKVLPRKIIFYGICNSKKVLFRKQIH